MKKQLLLLLLMLGGSSMMWCQSRFDGIENRKISLSINGGYGTYWMGGLKKMQNSMIGSTDLPLIKTSSFPPYLNYALKIGSNWSKYSEGLIFGMMSTGSRSSLSDYSGTFFSDINCQANYVGFYRKKFSGGFSNHGLNFNTGYTTNVSFVYSDVSFHQKLTLTGSDYVSEEALVLNCFGLYSEPSIFVQMPLSRHFFLEANLGVGISLCTPLYYETFNLRTMMEGSRRFANWSGLRLNVGLVFQ